MISNDEWDQLLVILEECEDEVLAVQYLKELNDLSKEQKTLLLNLDKNLQNDEWKKKCDEVDLKIQKLIKNIKML